MLFLHGSNTLIERPSVIITKYPKDFGYGFYTTRIYEQAARWARNKANQKGGFPCISKYEFLGSQGLKVQEFQSINDEWLDFIALCRRGGTHDYDIVEGPMADDEIWDHVEDYLNGYISREEFMLFAKFKQVTHQKSFHTEAALSRLLYKGGDILNDKRKKQKRGF